MTLDWMLFLQNPFACALVAGLFGLLIGSFLNVVIYRLPKMMERDWCIQCADYLGESIAPTCSEPLTLATPRSRCPACGHQISAFENIPVISWLLLRGRCSTCKASISPRYPIIEALTGALFAVSAVQFGYGWALLGAAILAGALVALTFIDIDTQLLPDSITLPLLWVGLFFNVFATYTDLQSAVIGAIVGYLSLWAVYWSFKLSTGKEGMGYGDFKLLAALGAWLGWQVLPLIILLSSLVGAVVGILLIALAKRGRNVPIPFGPYLSAAGVIALFWGKDLTQAYLRLM